MALPVAPVGDRAVVSLPGKAYGAVTVAEGTVVVVATAVPAKPDGTVTVTEGTVVVVLASARLLMGLTYERGPAAVSPAAVVVESTVTVDEATVVVELADEEDGTVTVDEGTVVVLVLDVEDDAGAIDDVPVVQPGTGISSGYIRQL